MSELKNVVQALGKFQEKMTPVKKGSDNPFFKSSYASLADIWKEVQPLLTECGLAVSQTTRSTEKEMFLVTTLYHSSGEFLSGEIPIARSYQTVTKAGEVLEETLGMQQLGSAITYARRYGLSAILGIVTEDDDDGNATQKPQPQKQPEQKPKPEFASEHPHAELEDMGVKLGEEIPKNAWNATKEKLDSLLRQAGMKRTQIRGKWMVEKI